MITIGRMAEKYGMLPSQIEQQATTYDLMIVDVLATWETYEQKKSSGKPLDMSDLNISQDDLQSILNKARKV